MNLPIYYVLPLLSGFIYAVGALISKRALNAGFGVARYIFLSNILLALCFHIFYISAEWPQSWAGVHWPLLAGFGFFLGQVFTFLAIRTGDVSVQAPVMGTKVVFVALFTVAMGAGPVPVDWWLGAILTAVAIFLLSASNFANRASTYRALVLSVISAAFFGWTDVMVQQGAAGFHPGTFLILMNYSLVLSSMTLIPFFRGRLRDTPPEAWKWGLISATLIGIQAVGMALAIAFHGRATAVNILYSSRGLWSVLLVWVAGSLFANIEGKAGKRIMQRRLVGATLLCIAIALVLTA